MARIVMGALVLPSLVNLHVVLFGRGQSPDYQIGLSRRYVCLTACLGHVATGDRNILSSLGSWLEAYVASLLSDGEEAALFGCIKFCGAVYNRGRA